MQERAELTQAKAVDRRSEGSTAVALSARRFMRIAGGWATAAVVALLIAVGASAAGSLPVAPVSLNASEAYNGLQVTPTTIIYTGDGTGFLGGANVRDRHSGIDWSKWTADVALGTGFNQLNNCEPSCAGGQFHGYPVKIELWRPRTLAGTLVFTRMTIFYRRGRPPGQPHHYTFTDTYEGAGAGGYGWGPPSGQACTHAYGLKPAADCKNIHSLP
ncbi:MAG TPA: hypothetical protein VGP17_10155 [Solirubrobacteraceae bacterium]|nr:hypothetical protein [Solirubrobacteraceae bacterium]